MSLFRIEFPELYARHLCRHSQFGINVAHVIALYGIWFALYGITNSLLTLAGVGPWGLLLPAAIYLAAVAANVPLQVWAVTGVFVALLLAPFFVLPELPVWMIAVYVLLVPVWYKVQAWSHKIWDVERDMTEFNTKYPKGRLLFVVLLVYDLPILLNYLIFDRSEPDS
jgi:hypothetical protein